MGESKSSINIEEIKRMQPLYHSLANLFQFLGDDKLKQEISKSEQLVGKGKKKKTVRAFYEKVLADTKTQMHLATATQIEPQEVSSLSNPHRLPVGFKTQRFKKQLESYKKNYCWLSGVKITDAQGILLSPPGPGIHCGKNPPETINEDEHAISFYYMLFMFGGIASVPQTFSDTNYSRELLKAKQKVQELMDTNVINTDLQRYPGEKISDEDARLVDLVRTNDSSIANLGSDSTLYSRTFDLSLELTRFMNVDHHTLIGNKTSLNYLGLWLSFCYLNRFKSNYNFYRLSFEIMTSPDGEQYLYNPYFRTSNTRIDKFVEFVDIIKSGNDDRATDFSKENKPEEDKPVKKGRRIFFYPRKTNSLTNFKRQEFRDDTYLSSLWNSDIAKNNIKTVMNLLCNEGSMLMIHRVFYNCVIAYYLQSNFNKKNQKKDREDPLDLRRRTPFKWSSDHITVKRAPYPITRPMTTDTFSQARTNNANQVLDRDYSQYLPSIKESRGDDAKEVDDGPEKTTNNVRDFIKNYIICQDLDISTIKHKGLRDMLAMLVLDQTVEHIPEIVHIPVSSQPPRPSAPVYTPQPAVVIKNYQINPLEVHKDARELPLTIDENVMILEPPNQHGWTRAKSSTGEEGWIHMENVKPILDAVEEEENEEDDDDCDDYNDDDDYANYYKGSCLSRRSPSQPPAKRRRLRGGKKKTKKRKYKNKRRKKTKKNIVKKQRKGKRKKKTRKLTQI